MTTIHQLTPLYLAVLLGVALIWLWQVAQAARKNLWPQLGVLMPLGLGALLAAPVLDVPALFGMGAAFVLIAAYFPLLRLRPLPGRTTLVWTWLGLGFSAALMMVSVQLQSVAGVLWAVPAALLSLALLLSRVLSPRRRPPRAAQLPATNAFLRRWQGVVTPSLPDLELTLEVGAAKLLNTSGRTLHLAGWSPVSDNAWLSTRSADGSPLSRLPAGATAYLTPWSPLDSSSAGVRLWYAREGEDTTYLFRADWASSWVRGTPDAGERVLN